MHDTKYESVWSAESVQSTTIVYRLTKDNKGPLGESQKNLVINPH